MKLIVPTSFETEFLGALAGYPVKALYGSLPHEPGARAPQWLPAAPEEQVAAHIAQARAQGIGFLYTMNATCSGNREFTGEGQRWLAERLGWLVEAGAEGVVASSPYTTEMVKGRYRELKVSVSSLANVDSVDKALFYQDLGVDIIYLPEYVNRDFKLLRGLRRQVRCALGVVVNLGCLLHCPLRDYHANFISHASESLERGCYVDYAIAKCTQVKTTTPVEVLKAPWIRPEDVAKYEEVGIDYYKLAGREQGSAWILRAVAAYAARSYKGNLNDVVIGLEALEPFGCLPLWVDNTRLDGFVEYFEKKDCRLGCGGCTHCQEWAQQAVTAGDDRQRYGDGIERLLRRFTSGSFRAPLVRV